MRTATQAGTAPVHRPCPCGTGVDYAECCGRFHRDHGALAAPDALTLMRSRYSAYVLGLEDHLLRTWHPSTRPAALEPMPPGLRWLGLEVLDHRTDGTDQASVEFVARSKLAGRAHRLHERSRFERVAGRWYYVEGSTPPEPAPRSAGHPQGG